MRIAKPMLLVTTPIGMVWGLVEAARFHWWLALLMAVLFFGVAALIGMTVRRIRLERHAQLPPARERAWELLSELFVDTEHDEAALLALGRNLADTKFGATTLEIILREEVAPIAGAWMRWPTVGPWPGFDTSALNAKIRAYIERPWYSLNFRARALESYPGVAEDWSVARRALDTAA
jgi:hypothetical protein